LNLGLDLKGGVHLVLRVQTDDALRSETETTVERLRDSLSRANVQFSKLEATAADQFRFEGISDDCRVPHRGRGCRNDLRPQFRARRLHLQDEAEPRRQLREEAVTQALQTIERRVNELGVAEPVIARQGGSRSSSSCRRQRRATARSRSSARLPSLQFRLVEDGPFPTQESALEKYNKVLPPDPKCCRAARKRERGRRPPRPAYYVVKKTSVVTGNELRSARRDSISSTGRRCSSRSKQDAAQRFGNFTADEHRQAAWHHPRQARDVGGDHPGPHRRQRPDQRHHP
jgi:preprotein translocase subunit SecD